AGTLALRLRPGLAGERRRGGCGTAAGQAYRGARLSVAPLRTLGLRRQRTGTRRGPDLQRRGGLQPGRRARRTTPQGPPVPPDRRGRGVRARCPADLV